MPRPLNPNNYYGWRKLVLQRDCYKCVVCGSKNNVEVDHIKPFSKFPDLRFDLSNGRALCKPCHKKTCTYGGKMLKGRRVEVDPYGSHTNY